MLGTCIDPVIAQLMMTGLGKSTSHFSRHGQFSGMWRLEIDYTV